MQPIRVSINAKGGDCWHVYRKSVLVIDGKNRRRAEGEKSQEEERQWSLDHQSRIPDNHWIILSGRTG
jgi:hypothetical protein